MVRLLSVLAYWSHRSPQWILTLAALASALSVLAAVKLLTFSTDRTDLLDPREKVQQTWQHYRTEFGKTSDFVILLEGGDAGAREEAVEALGRAILAHPELFEAPFYRLDLPGLAQHALYYLPTSSLRHVAQELRISRPWLELLTQPQGEVLLLRRLRALGPEEAARQLGPAIPLLNRVLRQLLEGLESRGTASYQSPLGDYQPEVELVSGQAQPGQTRFYNQLPDGLTHVLVVRARERGGVYWTDVDTLRVLREILGTVMRSRGQTARLSGEPVINTDEMVGAQRDALRAGLLALVSISLLLSVAFRAVLLPQLVVLALLVGMGWSLGFAALAVGTLNLITINFATVLLGLGMTFGIQILYRYREERSQGLPPAAALERTLVGAGSENLVGALTTAVAFWALAFTPFRAAGELGVIAGTGVLLCYLSMLTVLPSLLMLRERYALAPAARPGANWLLRREVTLSRFPGRVLLAATALTLYSLTWVLSIPFDYNVLNMSPARAEAIEIEHFLQARGYSSLYALSVARDQTQAASRTAAFLALPTVARVESLASLAPHQIGLKQPLVEAIVRESRQLVLPQPAVPARSVLQLLALRRSFLLFQARLAELRPWLERGAYRQPAEQLFSLMRRLEGTVQGMGPGAIQESLASFEEHFVADLTVRFRFLQQQIATPPDILGTLPEALRTRSIGATGMIGIRVFPRQDVWEREPLERFVHDLQRVDADVTGPPVLIYYYLEALRQAYSVSGRNALVVIALLLLIHFRSVRQAGLAMFPKLLGLIWMIGLMGTLGVGFNAANFMALPLTLGIGLVFGVQVLAECLRGRLLFASSTGPSLLLSGLTAIVGFASLMSAEHRGIASLGLVMAIGVGTNLLTSLIVLPALLRGKPPPSPGTAAPCASCGRS